MRARAQRTKKTTTKKTQAMERRCRRRPSSKSTPRLLPSWLQRSPNRRAARAAWRGAFGRRPSWKSRDEARGAGKLVSFSSFRFDEFSGEAKLLSSLFQKKEKRKEKWESKKKKRKTSASAEARASRPRRLTCTRTTRQTSTFLRLPMRRTRARASRRRREEGTGRFVCSIVFLELHVLALFFFSRSLSHPLLRSLSCSENFTSASCRTRRGPRMRRS